METVDQISPKFLVDMDYVITLCTEEVCPVLVSKAKKLHWPLPDPAGQINLSKNEQLQRFRDTRDTIRLKWVELKKELGI